MEGKKRIFKTLIKLIGVSLFIVILCRLDLAQIGLILSRANIYYIFLMVILVLPMLMIKSWRWRKILKHFSIQISYANSLKFYAIGMFAGFLTPGQVGDLSKSYYLGRMGFQMGPSLLSVFLDRIFDLLILILAAFWGVEIYWRFMGEGMLTGMILFLLAPLILLLFAVKRIRTPLLSRMIPVAEKIFKKGSPGSIGEKISFSPGIMDMLIIFFLTVLVYGIIFFRYYLLAMAVGIPLSFMSVTGAMALSSTLALLPISVANVGTRDALLIYLFSGWGISAEQTVSFSTLVLLSFVLNGVIGCFAWLTTGSKKSSRP